MRGLNDPPNLYLFYDTKFFFQASFFFFFFTKYRKCTAKEERAMATQSNWKDFSQLLIKREFWTTTLVINQRQANLKRRKIKRAGENRDPGSGSRWTELSGRTAGSGAVPLSRPPPPDHLEQPQRKQTTPTHFPAASQQPQSTHTSSANVQNYIRSINVKRGKSSTRDE